MKAKIKTIIARKLSDNLPANWVRILKLAEKQGYVAIPEDAKEKWKTLYALRGLERRGIIRVRFVGGKALIELNIKGFEVVKRLNDRYVRVILYL